MSSFLDGPACAFLVSICMEDKYCFSPPICIGLYTEKLSN